MRVMFISLLSLYFVASQVAISQKTIINVKVSNGTTLQQAFDQVQQLNNSGQYPSGGVEIILSGGEYKVGSGYNLTSLHSGTSANPLIVKAAEGEEVVLFGGEYLSNDWFAPVSDQNFISKLTDADAADYILVANLKAHGITDFGEISRHGWMLEPPTRVAPVGLVIGGERMELARWPNKDEELPYLDEMAANEGLKGMVSYTSIIDPGPVKTSSDWYNDPVFMGSGGTFSVDFDRMKYWNLPDKVWLDGVLGTTWEWTYNKVASVDVGAKTITLAHGELNGLGGRLERVSHFYFENIPEEIDQPGEYYIDRENGLLYVYPPADFENKSIFLSSLAADVFNCQQSKYITFKDLTVDAGRKNGFYLNRCENVTIEACEVRNVSMGGVYMKGKNNRVTQSHIHDVGAFGVQIQGSAKGNLIAENNIADFCRIHSLGWDQKSQMPGVFLNRGVGNHARNNEIFDCPHFAIRMNRTNDCTMENNRIHDLPTYHMFDGGAVYVYTEPKEPQNRGNIVKNNFLYNVPTNGIYADNYAMGVFIEQNYLYNVGYLIGEWGFGAVMLNTGGQNRINDNIFVDCPIPVRYGTGGYHQVYKNKPEVQEIWNDVIAQYGNGKVESTPYNKYPTFKEFLALSPANDYDEFKWPVSYASRNLIYNRNVRLEASANNPSGYHNDKSKIIVSDTWNPSEDPGFKNFSGLNFLLDENSPAFDNINGFQPGDFSVFHMDTVTAIENAEVKLFSFYPNPAKKTVFIHSDEVISLVRIFNMNGQLMEQYQLEATEGQIDISSLRNGMYMIQCQTKKQAQGFLLTIKH
ncbi:T9SS type A sorting domain-containing protein [Labilibacter sediminis]|nr:T9SS type A sorting domain-containing protein [Labilibacter sediminis]